MQWSQTARTYFIYYIFKLLNIIYFSKMCVCMYVCIYIYIYIYIYTHYIAKSIGSPTFNERFDYFSNFHEYKS